MFWPIFAFSSTCKCDDFTTYTFSYGTNCIAGLAGVTFCLLDNKLLESSRVVLRYMTSVVNYLAQLPLASAEIVFNFTAVIISYIALVTLMIHMWRRTNYQFRNYNVIE
jgi:hypothetical protein